MATELPLVGDCTACYAPAMTTAENYADLVVAAVCDEAEFQRLTLTAPAKDTETGCVKACLRPIMLKGERFLSCDLSDGKKNTTKNYPAAEAAERTRELLALGFTRIHAESRTRALHVRITRKGKALVSSGRPSSPSCETVRSHDRPKIKPLRIPEDAAFLETIGIMKKSGGMHKGQRAKLHQVNEFLTILAQALPAQAPTDSPLHIVDCGCGSAYLTLAAYQYLTTKQDLPVRITGIDANAELIEKCNAAAVQLGWSSHVAFQTSPIADFEPDTPPGVVLGLHACNTATDDALAQAVRWKAHVILAAPCCQHELHDRLASHPLRAVFRHGILKQRTADIVTDAFRAAILRIAGYKAEVIEFISPADTSKNLMIRAVARSQGGSAAARAEYAALKEFWQVTPYLETALRDSLPDLPE